MSISSVALNSRSGIGGQSSMVSIYLVATVVDNHGIKSYYTN
jgi:hypothetical protein